MSDWQKDIAEVKTELKFLREDVNIMQKQIRNLNKSNKMGLGGLKVALFIGGILGAIYTFMKILD